MSFTLALLDGHIASTLVESNKENCLTYLYHLWKNHRLISSSTWQRHLISTILSKKKGCPQGEKTHLTKFTTWLVALTIQMTRIKCSVPQQELQVLTTTRPVHCHSGSSDLVATSGTLHTYALRFSVDVTWTYPKSCKGEVNDDKNLGSRQDCCY